MIVPVKANFRICACKAGCGLMFDVTKPNQRYAAECPNAERERRERGNEARRRFDERQRAARAARPRPCRCEGGCGLVLDASHNSRQRYHPDCPVKRAHTLSLGRTPRTGRRSTRCTKCEGMAHRRPETGCKGCGEAFEAERLPPTGYYLSNMFGDSGYTLR